MNDTPPLSGIRVLDLTRLVPGGFATMLLADMGAAVDKVEDPHAGDYLRSLPPKVEGMNAVFRMLGRGKRSLVLDLKTSAGREALLRLLPRYDVLVEGFRPGVMERLGLDWETLRAVHPRLVCCAITGYGQQGPLAGRAGHDVNYLARAGVLGLTGPEEGPPQIPGVQIGDIGGGAMFAVTNILAALHARDRTGEGRYVDVSMCEGALSFGVFGLLNRYAGAELPRGSDVLMGGIAPYQTYMTRDGEAMALGALEPKFWTAFCRGVGLEPDMSALLPGPHQEEWKRTLRRIFAERTRAQWERFAEEHDCCLEPVLSPEEVMEDAQHRARGVFAEPSEHAGNAIPGPRTPAGGPATTRPAPEHGEHTEEILRECGMSDEDLEALRRAGAS